MKMARKVGRLVLLLVVFGVALCDIFIHNPRGSNNRLNEDTADRTNNNRLFDSQNNNKGGYNTGDRFDRPAKTEPRRQYSMQYYASGPSTREESKLMIEWTNQHGCGGNEKNLCNVVVQYMCGNNGTGDDFYPTNRRMGKKWNPTDLVVSLNQYLRDGTSTDSQDYKNPRKSETDMKYVNRMNKLFEGVDDARSLHETAWWYDSCRHREANGGLFTADQNLETDKVGYVTASRTRQNSNGGRSGFECPEERDYYPYWQPTWQSDEVDEKYQHTPWLDAAWLGDKRRCSHITKESFNQKTIYRCVFKGARSYGRAINEAACKKEGGKWVGFNSFLEVLSDVKSESACKSKASSDRRNNIVWTTLRSDSKKKKCVVQAPKPECHEGPQTRANHLGNAEYDMMGSTGLRGNTSSFEWNMPYFPSGKAKRCVLRLRYNITTTDYHPFKTDHRSNNKADVIDTDPKIDVFGNGAKIELAINTAQVGRTFQDRTHVFQVLPRLKTMRNRKLYNLNVRGKRGTLTQLIPAVEYDFVPDRLTVGVSDLVHVQWAGANSHKNKDDGSTGEGKSGTDRHNLLQMVDLGKSYPLKIKDARFWDNVKSLTDPKASGKDIAIGLGSAGFYKNENDLKKSKKMDEKMDKAPASYFGHVLEFKKPGTLFYVCTRNNNFSNRSQKGALWVSSRAKLAEKREKRDAKVKE